MAESVDTNEVKNNGDAKKEACCSKLEYALAFQGGAGNISCNASNAKKRVPLKKVLKQILKSAHNYCQLGLKGELTALDIVEKVVNLFENSAHFNAGRGSVYSKSGKHEMEASIMNGSDLKCGAVSLLRNIKNPISAAVDIMNTTDHVYLIGDGANQHIKQLLLNTNPYNYYEKHNRQPPSFENDKYFYSEKRWSSYCKIKQQNEKELITKSIRSEDEDQLNETNDNSNTKKHDGYDDYDEIFEGNTVGCVVMLNGNVAAATSTGGMTYKLNGRIGDSPIIGSGTYADNNYGAISCTGCGEDFMKHVTAYDIIARVKYCKINLQKAIEDHLKECFEPGIGGAVAVDKNGNFGIAFNTSGMIRGYFNSNDKQYGHVAILKNDQEIVDFNKQSSREDVDDDYEGSDDDNCDDEKYQEYNNKKQKKEMDSTNDNPYLDSSLMQGFEKFTPQQNQAFVSSHGTTQKSAKSDK